MFHSKIKDVNSIISRVFWPKCTCIYLVGGAESPSTHSTSQNPHGQNFLFTFTVGFTGAGGKSKGMAIISPADVNQHNSTKINKTNFYTFSE